MIYCCGCKKYVEADLVDGKTIYPSRQDLHKLPFWICRRCNNYVGCHNKTKDPTKPLGCIPTAELRNARTHIHALLDPLWLSKQYTRSYVYARLSELLGYQYHTSELRTIEEARRVYRVLKQFKSTTHLV